MRSTNKNKIVFGILLVLIIPVLTLTVIVPRLSFLTELSGSGEMKTEVYDVYLADYSEHPDLDTTRLTLKLLLDVRNPYNDRKIVIPRISATLGYLDKEVGKIWTREELVLEPFVDEDSNSAGLLSLFITIYVGGKDSGFAELVNGLLLGELGAITLDATMYLGDVPINIDIVLGYLTNLLLGEEGEDGGAFDISMILGLLSGGEDEEDEEDDVLLIPEDYLFLYNSTVMPENQLDIRALLNKENRSIFYQVGDSLMCGAEDAFTKIHWENGTSGNNATGDGLYSWQYWNGNTWNNLGAITDGTNKFTKTGDITFTKPTDWKKREATAFWDREYYYIRCLVQGIDSGVNITTTNKSYLTMNVKKSYVNNYDPPSKSSVELRKANPPPMLAKTKYPELDEFDIPLEKGLLKTDLELEDYLLANGVVLDDLVDDYLIDAVVLGLEKAGKTPNIYATQEDMPEGEGSLEIDVLLSKMTEFLASHNLDIAGFLISAEVDFEGIIEYLGSNFEGLIAPDGIDISTGEDIYRPISETLQYQNSITYAIIVLIVMFILLGIISPYLAQKRVDQSKFFDQISNLDKYIEKVKADVEKGITEDEIELLKTASFKKKDFMTIDKKKGEDDKK